jgi:GT2 family glycosyltransferase
MPRMALTLNPSPNFGRGTWNRREDILNSKALSMELPPVQDTEPSLADLKAQAQTWVAQEDWPAALDCYQQIVAQAPGDWQAYHQLGDIWLRLHRWQEAAVAYQQALDLRCDQAWTWHNLALALRKLGQRQQALNCCQALTNLEPAFWDQHRQDPAVAALGAWFEIHQQGQRGDWLQALGAYQALFERYPETVQVLEYPALLEWLRVTPVQWQAVLSAHQRATQQESAVAQALEQFAQAGVALLAALEQCPQVQALRLPRSQQPLVSVIIPVYNKLDYTYRCLESLAKYLDAGTPVEIIVVNDCSTDDTRAVLAGVEGLTLIHNEENAGFIRSCNAGAAAANGAYLYFLNNDTEIRPGSLEALVAVLDNDQQVGAVGSKLIYPNGALQESGGIIWADASGWNYGRLENPFDPQYNYVRPVDYCSAASLLVRRWCFEALGGFEQAFIPAYYEDTDLCFGIRHVLGFQVLCQPRSEVIHYEGISSGTSTSSGVKRYQVVNGEKFRQKWQAVLAQHWPNQGAAGVPKAARRYLGDRTVLLVNPYPPCYDKESGSRRLFEIIKLFKQLHYHVIFAPDNGLKEEPYVSELQDLQVEVLYTQPGYGTPVVEQIEARLPLVDCAWVCFPAQAEKYLPLLRRHPHIKVIYDTIDLHYVRMQRAWALLPEPRDPAQAQAWQEMQQLELALARQADLTLTVTAVEQQVLQAQGVRSVAVMPNVHIPYGGQRPGFEQRQGLLFIGGYQHPPNVDGVVWLCEEIMPLLWQQLPGLTVTLLGSQPPAAVQQLAERDGRVVVPGYVADVSPYFLSHRVFVTPLRYGAGMKGKVGQSLEYGLPVVSTSVGVEGMNLVAGEQVLVADTAAALAAAVLRVYQEPDLWAQLAAAAQVAIAPYTPAAMGERLGAILAPLLG